MTVSIPITNAEGFLKLPYINESPVWKYIDTILVQKPMGGAKHSLLQNYAAHLVIAQYFQMYRYVANITRYKFYSVC